MLKPPIYDSEIEPTIRKHVYVSWLFQRTMAYYLFSPYKKAATNRKRLLGPTQWRLVA